MEEHILIRGERRTGKTALIERLLGHSRIPIGGYCTKIMASRADGYHEIYMYPAVFTERPMTEANHVGDCNTRQRTVNTEVFETLGLSLLRSVPGGIVVMDELGFMEAQAVRFCQAATELLDKDVHILAACKPRDDVGFLNGILSHPKVRVCDITEENRDELYETLLPIILKWNGETKCSSI